MSTVKKEASSLFRPPATNELYPVTLRHILIDERISAHCGARIPASPGRRDWSRHGHSCLPPGAACSGVV